MSAETIPPPDPRAARIEQIRRMAEQKPAEAPAVVAPAAAPAEVTKPAEAPVSEAATPPAAAVPPASPFKRKIRANDADHELDLEQMAREKPEDLDKLLGQGLSHERIRDELKAARDKALAVVESARGDAATARDREWVATLQAKGYTVVRNLVTGGIDIVPMSAPQATQAAAPAQTGRTDLDALKRRAFESGAPEDWQKWADAISARSSTQLTEAQVRQIMEKQLTDARAAEAAAAQEARAQAEQVSAFDRKMAAEFESHKALFEKTGPLADRWRGVAREAALAASFQQGATEESVLQKIRETAKFAGESVGIAQQQLQAASAAKPRPPAPTVVRAGAPAATVADPRNGTVMTKEQRIAWIKEQARIRESRMPTAV